MVELLPFGELPRNLTVNFMAQADVFISKAGDAAPTEAIRLGVPMVLYDWFGGNEMENHRFLVERGVAISAELDEIGAKANLLLAHEDLRAEIRRNQKAFVSAANREKPVRAEGEVEPAPRADLKTAVRDELSSIEAWMNSQEAEKRFVDELARVARVAMQGLSPDEAQRFAEYAHSRVKLARGYRSMMLDFCFSYGRVGGITFAAIHIVKNILISFPLYAISAWTGNAALFGVTVVIHQGPWDFLGAGVATGLKLLNDMFVDGMRMRWRFGLLSLREVHEALAEAVGPYDRDEVVLEAFVREDGARLFSARRPANPNEARVSIKAIEEFVAAQKGGAALLERLTEFRPRTEVYAQILLSYFGEASMESFTPIDEALHSTAIENYLVGVRRGRAELKVTSFILNRVLGEGLKNGEVRPGRAARLFGAIPIPLVQVVRALGRWAPVRHGLQVMFRVSPEERKAQEFVAELRGTVKTLRAEARALEREMAVSELRTVYEYQSALGTEGDRAEVRVENESERFKSRMAEFRVLANEALDTARKLADGETSVEAGHQFILGAKHQIGRRNRCNAYLSKFAS